MDDPEGLFEEVEKVFDRGDGDAGFEQPEELANQCWLWSEAATMVLLNIKRKKKFTRSQIQKLNITKNMRLANLWGFHTFVRQLARKGGYIPPEMYDRKEKIDKACRYASNTLRKDHTIGPEAEAAMDEFADRMMASYNQDGMEMGKRKYLIVIELNLRWGYELGRGIFAG